MVLEEEMTLSGLTSRGAAKVKRREERRAIMTNSQDLEDESYLCLRGTTGYLSDLKAEALQ